MYCNLNLCCVEIEEKGKINVTSFLKTHFHEKDFLVSFVSPVASDSS